MNQVQKNMDDMWVCDYCGSEEVRTEVFVDVNTCGDDTKPITYFEFKEKIAEECGGNKDKYDEIMNGSRM